MKVKAIAISVIVLSAVVGFLAVDKYFVSRKEAAATKTGNEPAGSSGKKILFYRNPMNPQVTSPVPMKDEMGMDYVPVYQQEQVIESAGVYISPAKQQLIGVKKGKVENRRLAGQILTVGKVAYDPELFVAQEEFLQALKSRKSIQKGAPDYADEQSASFIKTAKRKLALMGMSEAEIDNLAAAGAADQNLYLPEGESVWVYIAVYEFEAGFVKIGLPVEMDAAAYPDQIFKGTIVSIAPVLETMTRSFKVRALVKNPEKKLKLGMFVNVKISYDLGEKLAVPSEAVMHTGAGNIVFVAQPNGYFEPKDVKLGVKSQNYYEVLQGLAVNDQVVTSGNFLIDSESKLNAALSQMKEPNR